MTNNINTNNTRTITPSINFFTFDHFNKKIVGTEQNFKKAGIPDSIQYIALMESIRRHPNYELSAVAPKVKKQTYAGLTTDLMREYVEIKGTPEQKEELEALIEKNEAYPTIKSWFLDYFKCGFTVEKAKNIVAYHKLSAKKKHVRLTVRAKAVKPVTVETEAPSVINF